MCTLAPRIDYVLAQRHPPLPDDLIDDPIDNVTHDGIPPHPTG